MVSLKSARIKGLFGYLDAYFEFADTLTIVTGSNGSGKSSLNFLVDWTFGDGLPEGDGLIFQIRDSADNIIKEIKAGSIEWLLSDGVVITKTRTRGGRTVYTHSKYKDPFTQSAVPDCVKESIGIVESTFGDIEKSMNFYFQHDAHFMLSETPTWGAKVLDKIAGVEIVSLAHKAFNSDKYMLTEAKNTADKEIKRILKELLRYESLDNQRLVIDSCIVLLQKIEEKILLIEKLKSLQETKKRLILTLSGINEQLVLIGDLEPVKKRLNDFKCNYHVYDSLCFLSREKVKFTGKLSQIFESLLSIGDLQPLKTRLFGIYQRQVLFGELLKLKFLLDSCSVTLNNCQNNLLPLLNINELKPRITAFLITEKLKNDLATLQNSRKNLISVFNSVTANLLTYDGISDKLVTVTQLKDRYDKFVLLSGVSLRLSLLRNKKTITDNALISLDNVFWLRNGIDQAKEKYQIYIQLRALSGQNQQLQRSLKSVTGLLQDQVTYISQYQKELKEAWNQAGGVCPLCKNMVKVDCKHE